MWMAFLAIIFLSIVIFTIGVSYCNNKRAIEKFEEMEKESMSKYQRSSVIIKAFQEARGSKPSPKELGAFYDEFAEKSKFDKSDVVPLLKDEAKYHTIMGNFFTSAAEDDADVDDEINPEVQTKKSNRIADEIDDEEAAILIQKSYEAVYPQEKLTKENTDFLIHKLKRLDNDLGALEDYLTSDTEYKENIKGKLARAFKLNLARDDQEKLQFKIARPDTNKTTLQVNAKELGKCEELKDFEDASVVSTIYNERQLDELKYACARSKKKYANVDSDMVLLPDQKWSVPQEHPDVCRGGSSEFNSSVEQTALIGTLLEDAADTKVGSIMPEFEFNDSDSSK